MRYALYFTPSLYDPLTLAASAWLGRNVYSDEACEQPDIVGFSRQELAFHTAVPRRYGFHAMIKAPFRLQADETEANLLKAMMTFAGSMAPFEIPRVEVARLGSFFGLAPAAPCDEMNHLAASTVQTFDGFRAPISDAELERQDLDGLTATQFSNLHRWGHPHVMDEFRFHMMLTGPINPNLRTLFDQVLRGYFDPLLQRPLKIASLALFIETEPGAPMRVHSQHPLGKLAAHRPLATKRDGLPLLSDEAPVRITEKQAALAVRRFQAG